MKFLHNRYLASMLIIVWLMTMISLYYASHKPFDINQIVDLGRIVWSVFISYVFISIAGGLGKRIWPTIEVNSLTATMLHAGLGLGILSFFFLLIGALLGVNKYMSWSILLLIGMILWRDSVQWWRGWLKLSHIWRSSGIFGRIIATGLVSIFVFTLTISLAPPVKFDTLVYHLAIPTEYINQGKINYLAGNIFWGMPQLSEMLYTWILSISRLETAAVISWSVGVLVAVGLIGYLEERFSIAAAWTALASLFSSYTLVILLPVAYADWFAVLYGFCVLTIFDLWYRTGKDRYVIWAGIFTAFGFGVKYTAGVLIVCGCCVIIFNQLRRKHFSSTRLTRSLALFIGTAIIAVSPWLVKNFLATGNPLYPFLFPSGEMDEHRLQFYNLPTWGSWRDLLLLPFMATFTGFEGAEGYSATLGPLLLALSPLAYIGFAQKPSEQRAFIHNSVIFGVGGLLVWAIASRFSGYLIQTRLYFAIFPAFSLLAGIGYANISKINLPGIRIGRIVGAIILLVFIMSIFQVAYEVIERNSIQVISDSSSSQSYLEHNLGWYYPAMQTINKLPSDSNVLMLWEPRGLYCLPKCESDEVLDRWMLVRHLFEEPDAIIQEWQNQGYTHLLVYELGVDFTKKNDLRYTDQDWLALDDLVNQLHHPVYFGDAYSLYSINE